jgi:F-type H+-transporting ATPase subunit b
LIGQSITQFADSSTASSGIGAFNINLKSFIFQFVTFLLVLYVFKRWILPPILKTLDERRQTLEDSLTNAQQTEETLHKTEARVAEALQAARAQADSALADAQAEAKKIIAEGEQKGEESAERIRKDAEAFLAQQGERLRQELKAELVGLVAETTARVIEQKLTPEEDMKLIQDAVKVLGK